jgi:AmpD protein
MSNISKLAKLPKLHINQKTGLLTEARFIQSPNYDLRPANTDLDLLVIHGISLPPGEFSNQHVNSEQHIINFFTNQLNPTEHPYFQEIINLQVSCHCFINRSGNIIQFVAFKDRAWHAGQSYFAGREDCNDFSIGIELEGTDTIPYTDFQYSSLKNLITAIQLNYPLITSDRIVGHSEIAPGRKTDPGPYFDWGRIK